MAPKYSLTRLMQEANLNIGGLAKKSGLSLPTVRRAVHGTHNGRLNTTSAAAIAEAIGSPVEAINWPGGLANQGRPARTGGKYSHANN